MNCQTGHDMKPSSLIAVLLALLMIGAMAVLSARVMQQSETLGLYRQLEAERAYALQQERALANACSDALSDVLGRIGAGQGPAGKLNQAIGGR